MAEHSSFFNGPTYDAADFAAYFASFFKNGIFAKPANCLQARALHNDMRITILPGVAFIDGYRYELDNSDSEFTFTVPTADGSLDRIDIVVVRRDLVNQIIKLVYVAGTPSSKPSVPGLTRTSDIDEIQLCRISVTHGAVKITDSDITDTRLDTDVCGIVAGVLQQIDTKTIGKQLDNFFELYRQRIVAEFTLYLNQLSSDETAATGKYNSFAALMDAYQSKAKSDFETWLNGIKGLLGTDEAGNLTNELNALKTRVSTLETTLSNNLLFSAAAWLGNSYSGCAYLSKS